MAPHRLFPDTPPTAVSFVGEEITAAYREDQEISAMCKTIIQNIIILGGLSVNLRFFRKSLNELGNTVLFRHFCTRVSMD